jgi:hypothetical protein
MTPQRTSPDRSCLAQALVYIILYISIGCQGTAVHQSAELESRLRNHQASIERLTRSLGDARSDRDLARREVGILRAELAKQQPVPEITQIAHSSARVDRIEVVALLSGGLDRDEVPGDELISLLIAPKGTNGETHRVPGELSVRFRDISLPDGDQLLSQISFNETESEALWQNGIVGRGFRMITPLPNISSSGRLVAHIRFTDTTGQQFDTIYPLNIATQSVDSSP